VPADVDITMYPILPQHVMGPEELARMGLLPEFLKKPARVVNYTKSVNGFVVDDLRVGELVAVDSNGNLVYKISCSNRIGEVKPCPPQTPCPQVVAPTPPTPPTPLVTTTSDDSFFPGWVKGLLGLLLALLLLALLLLVIKQLLRRSTSVPNPQPAPVIPLSPPFHPVLGYGHRGNNGEVWWGPFQQLSVSDRQLDGYHVAVDGRDAGVFKTRTRVENAGQQGSWLVTQQ